MASLLKGYLKIHPNWLNSVKIIFIQDFIGEAP
jgi:hypothetical protein